MRHLALNPIELLAGQRHAGLEFGARFYQSRLPGAAVRLRASPCRHLAEHARSLRGKLGAMRRILLCAMVLAACNKTGTSTTPPAEPSTPAADPLAGKPVVQNVEAKTGDVTTCPYSGRKFVVAENSPRWEYDGKNYVFCAEKALEEVKKDPAKYLADFRG